MFLDSPSYIINSLMSRLYIYIFLLIVTAYSCDGNKNQSAVVGQATAQDSVYSVKYAKGFKVNIYPEFKEVSVVDPWDSTKILQTYILVHKNKPLPEKLPKGILIRTPLEKVAVYSTIHSTTLNEIGAIETVAGVCEPQYINIDYVQNGIQNGSITNLGLASNPDVEKIIDIDPEVIFATPIQGLTYGSVAKTGIPIVETPDYMEILPLGRAEWIRFYSLFYENESKVDSLFQITEANYNSIKEKTSRVTNRPTVFTDLMYGSSWYTAGGDSFVSNMFADAGGAYVWKDEYTNGSRPLPFEQVLEKAEDAQFWLIKYNNPSVDLTYKGLQNEFKPYSYFSAFKDKNVYECNTAKIDYYEILPIHPDFILQDFAYIFHPDLFSGYEPRYYQKMKD